MFKVIDFLDSSSRAGGALRDTRNFFMGAIDDINPLKGKSWNSNDELPKINLSLSRKDINHFDEVINLAKDLSPYAYYMPNEINQPINSKIKINDVKYRAELKIHGTNNPHFNGPKRSYSIKIRKKEDKTYPFGMRRFALIIPSQSNLIGLFTYRIASSLGMITPQNFLVRVYINGVDQGIYHLEEKLNKTLLERNGLSGFDIVRSDDSWAHQYTDNHGTMFSFDYSGLNPKYVSGKSLHQLAVFKKLLNSNDIEYIKQHINVKKFVDYDVLRYIFGDNGHMTNNDNIKFIYNTSNGRLEPFFRIENHIEKIQPNPLTYSPERHVNLGMFTSNKLLSNLTKDNKYRALRNQAIYDMIKRKDEILGEFDQLMKSQLGILLNDTTNELPSRYFEYQSNRARKNLAHNLYFLEKYLNYSRVFVETIKVDHENYEIIIKPDSNAPIGSSQFNLIVGSEYIGKEFEFFDLSSGESKAIKVTANNEGNGIIDLNPILKNLQFSLSLNDDLEPKKNIYKFILRFDGIILDSKVVFLNKLSNRKILKRDTYTVIVNESSHVQTSVPKWFRQIDNKNLVIRSGVHRIDKDVVLPYGMNLEIDPGSTIILGEGASLLISGDFRVNGQPENPVVLRSEQVGKPFGSIAAVGDETTEVNINFLDISGGSEDIVNAKYFSGALSLYNHKSVKLKNSIVHNNYADDGLNVKNANILIKDNLFYSNKADQVDIDTGYGKIIGNFFSRKSLVGDKEEGGLDNNGDGLDLSDSKVIIIKNKIAEFLDKGFSIGENTSAVAFNNEFISNRSAITVKDESKVYLADNKYTNNEIDIEMYQKKMFFDYPSVFSLGRSKANLNIVKKGKSQYFKSPKMIDLDGFVSTSSLFETLSNIEWMKYE